MAWPGTLTAEEQDIVQVFVDKLFREAILKLVKSLNISNGIQEEWTNRVQALFTKISAGDIVPNGSGLDAAKALSKTEITTILTQLGNFLTTYNTAAHRATFVQAIGSVNMIRE